MQIDPANQDTALRKGLDEAVHLCIDMQRLFAPGGPWPTPWMERVLPQAVRLVRHAPARTVFTRFLTPASAEEMPGMWRAYYKKWPDVTRDRIEDQTLLDLMPDLQRFVPPATVFDKLIYSAFADGRLHRFLRDRNITTLIVTGSETDVCVLASVLAAIDLGYRIVIAQDGVCSSADTSHDAMINLFNCRFNVQVALLDTAEILDRWRP